MITILYDDQDEQGRDADPDEGKPLCSDGGGRDGGEGRQHQRPGDVIIIILNLYRHCKHHHRHGREG